MNIFQKIVELNNKFDASVTPTGDGSDKSHLFKGTDYGKLLKADDNSGDDGMYLVQAYRAAKKGHSSYEETEDGAIKIDMGAGDDIFNFGRFNADKNAKVINKFGGQKDVVVDMGVGGNDIFRLAGSVDDFSVELGEDGNLTFTNIYTEQSVTVINAEVIRFDNKNFNSDFTKFNGNYDNVDFSAADIQQALTLEQLNLVDTHFAEEEDAVA